MAIRNTQMRIRGVFSKIVLPSMLIASFLLSPAAEAAKKKSTKKETSWTLPIIGAGLMAFGIWKIFSDKKKAKATPTPSPTPSITPFEPKHPLPDFASGSTADDNSADIEAARADPLAAQAQTVPFDPKNPDAFMQCYMGVLNKKYKLETFEESAPKDFLRFLHSIKSDMGCDLGSNSANLIEIEKFKENDTSSDTNAQELVATIEKELSNSQSALLKVHTSPEDINSICHKSSAFIFADGTDNKSRAFLISPLLDKTSAESPLLEFADGGISQDLPPASENNSHVLVTIRGMSEQVPVPTRISKCYTINPAAIEKCAQSEKFKKLGCEKFLTFPEKTAEERPATESSHTAGDGK